jgi:hypothetical protein
MQGHNPHMAVAYAALAITICLSTAPSVQRVPDYPHAIAGIGSVRTWEVNDLVNRFRITYKSGKARRYTILQYVFENGEHMFHSALAISEHRLVVTHNHGACIVDDRCRVLAELSDKPPVDYDVIGYKRVRSKRQEGPNDVWLRARAWNGKTLLATDYETRAGYLTLLDDKLRRLVALDFQHRRIDRIRPDGRSGWLVELAGQKQELVRISNKGAVRFYHRSLHRTY